MPSKKNIFKIAFAASEVAPLSKTGGLADVAGALPRQLRALGHDVRVFTPLHAGIDRSQLTLQKSAELADFPIALGALEYRVSVVQTTLPNSDVPIYLIDC